MRCMLKHFLSCISAGVEQLCSLAKLWYFIVYDKQETQLSQRDCAHFLSLNILLSHSSSLKVIRTKRHCWIGHVYAPINSIETMSVYRTIPFLRHSASKMAWSCNRGRVGSRSLKMAPFNRSYDFLLVRKYRSILYRFWVIWRWIISWPWNVGYSSLKVIQNGTIRKLECGFLFTFHSNYGSVLHKLGGNSSFN